MAISYMPKTSADIRAIKMKVTMSPINQLQFYCQIRVVEFKCLCFHLTKLSGTEVYDEG